MRGLEKGLFTSRRLKEVRPIFMKTTVGLWIDYQMAVIVFVTGGDVEIKLIYSNVKKKYKLSSASVLANILEQRELTGYLSSYYDEVISSLWNSGAILIMGPGEAKDELKTRLEINNRKGRIVDVETVDKMTDCQIVTKAREHSLKQISRDSTR
jgi:hypothetical protein